MAVSRKTPVSNKPEDVDWTPARGAHDGPPAGNAAERVSMTAASKTKVAVLRRPFLKTACVKRFPTKTQDIICAQTWAQLLTD